MEKYLLWSGAATDPSGYGEATRGYLSALAQMPDLSTKLICKSFWTGDPPDLRNVWPTLAKLHSNNFDRRRPHVFIQHLTPDQWKLGIGDCRYHIGMTTFETTSVPGGWQVNMRSMDELWTFSEWAKGVFQEQGIRRPITVIPHGVDIIQFRPGLVPLPGLQRLENSSLINPATFVFGSNFDWTERKNPTALLKAYFLAFGPTDDVALVLKTYYQYPLERSREFIMGHIREVKRLMGVSEKGPKVILLTDIMPQSMIPRFYNSLDAYVLPSRGEGWGLTFSEAMACGLPTVAVGWSGNTEFMNDTNSLLCKNFKLREITREDAPFQEQYIGHQWADVNVEELSQNMKMLYLDRERGQQIGQQARMDMMERFTWNAAGKVAKARLDEIFSSL